MTLIADVQARINSRELIALTNPEDPNASAIDTTLLGLVCDDVAGEFATHVGAEYSSDDASHVPIGTQGVVLMLKLYKKHSTALEERLEAWRKRLDTLALTEGRDRVNWESEDMDNATENDKMATRDEAFDELNVIGPDGSNSDDE